VLPFHGHTRLFSVFIIAVSAAAFQYTIIIFSVRLSTAGSACIQFAKGTDKPCDSGIRTHGTVRAFSFVTEFSPLNQCNCTEAAFSSVNQETMRIVW
jgi:hypothetical protein